MNIFRFELKQYRNSAIIWSIGLAVTIMVLLPMFIAFTADPSAAEALADNPLLETMGISIDVFFTSTGIFSYLNSIIIVAGAIQACNLGLSIITKEHMQNTADFLITKPYSRRNIFLSKLFASICLIGFVSLCYFLASITTMTFLLDDPYTFWPFFQIFLTFPLIQLFFLFLGIMISVLLSRVGSPLPVAMGFGFGFYVIGLFSNVIQSTVARLFSPYRYFDINLILDSTSYETGFLILFTVLVVLFLITSYIVFIKKDMKMVL